MSGAKWNRAGNTPELRTNRNHEIRYGERAKAFSERFREVNCRINTQKTGNKQIVCAKGTILYRLNCALSLSLPTRGGWIEILREWSVRRKQGRPSPHGEGGLKYVHGKLLELAIRGPSPHGEGGLKFFSAIKNIHMLCPSPHGEGGLKFTLRSGQNAPAKVPPHTGRVD